MFLNIAAPEIVLGASLLGLFVTLNVASGFLTLLLAHVAFSIAYVTVTVRARWPDSTRRWRKPPPTWARTPGSRSGRSPCR